jgi:hypothetical protein
MGPMTKALNPLIRGLAANHHLRMAAQIVAVGTVEQDTPLPGIRFTHRRRQVRAWLTRLGPIWLAKAAGRRLRVHLDGGRVSTTAKSWRLSEPVSTRQSISRLSTPFLPAQETS